MLTCIISGFLYHPLKVGRHVRPRYGCAPPLRKTYILFQSAADGLVTNQHGINHEDRMYAYVGIVVELLTTVLIACKAV